ncbi:MAG: fibronectin type III domain-containing protein, partial [Nitrospira sp.]|nr:fibronectin type III domain-containing protein [Nitrospira sp.]
MARCRNNTISLLTTCLVILGGTINSAFAADTEAPTIPSNLTANVSNSVRVDLTWGASTDLGGGVVAGYDVYRNGVKIKNNVTSTSYSDLTVQSNTTYSYQVDAFDDASPRNKSPKSNTASLTMPGTATTTDSEGPIAPGNLSAIASSPTQVNLSWTASTDLGGGVVAGYDIYRDGAKLKASVISTSFSDTTAQPNTIYSYQVDAFDDASPRNKSRKSNMVSLTTPSTTNDTARPTTPSNLTATASSPTQVKLVWTASTDLGGGVVAGYDIWRDGAKLKANITSTSYSDPTAQPNTTYSYQVDAFDDASPRNKSPKSNTASVTTPKSTPPVSDVDLPTVPPNLTGKAINPRKVTLWWTSSRDTSGGVVMGYIVYRDGVSIATVTEPHYSDLAVQANTIYSYRVVAFDDAVPANLSILSPALEVAVPAEEPACVGVTIAPTDNAVNIVQS